MIMKFRKKVLNCLILILNCFVVPIRSGNSWIETMQKNMRQLFSAEYGKLDFLQNYDFIIVGSSPAGCVLANRLSEDSNVTVLLLEAGEPEMILNDVMLGATLGQSNSYNWGYDIEPQKRACLSMKNHKCKWPHGRGLGGSTLLNGMIYTRGNRRDYDRWSEAGNTGWSFKDVLPYFIKSENSFLKDFSNNGYHGHTGPLFVEDIPYRSKLAHAFVESAKEYGLPYVDYNAREQLGVSYIQSTSQFGWRYSAAESYLHPIRKRNNLHISPRSWVTKVNFKSITKASGVDFYKNNRKYTIQVSKEVILSAGSFESPKLLMLSGVGPANDLKKHEIEVVKDLPVGRLLYDHVAFYGPIFIVDNIGGDLINDDKMISESANSKWLSGRGSLAVNGVETLAYFKTNVSDDYDAEYPDVEVMQSIGFDTSTDAQRTLGLSKEANDAVFRPLQNKHAFQFMPMLLHPKSKGYLKLKSINPFHHPELHANYFKNDHDMKTLIAAVRVIQEIVKQKSFQKLGVEPYEAIIPGCESHTFDTDDYWRCYIMHLTATTHHQVSTCKMGPASDSSSVVDASLRVHGFENLRVADLSVIPEPPSAYTSAISFMIGEKVADMIKREWKMINDQELILMNKLKKRNVRFDWQKDPTTSERQILTEDHDTRFVSFEFETQRDHSKTLIQRNNNGTTEPKSIISLLRPHKDELTTSTTENSSSLSISNLTVQEEMSTKKTISVMSLLSTTTTLKPNIDNLTTTLRPPLKNVVSTKIPIPLEMLSKDMPSLDEDMVRIYTVKNGSTYGKGREKAKFITAKLKNMNFTEFNDNNLTIIFDTQNQSDSGTKVTINDSPVTTIIVNRRKRETWFPFSLSSSASATPQATDRNEPSLFRSMLSSAWKAVNSGMFKMAEYTRNTMVPMPKKLETVELTVEESNNL